MSPGKCTGWSDGIFSARCAGAIRKKKFFHPSVVVFVFSFLNIQTKDVGCRRRRFRNFGVDFAKFGVGFVFSDLSFSNKFFFKVKNVSKSFRVNRKRKFAAKFRPKTDNYPDAKKYRMKILHHFEIVAILTSSAFIDGGSEVGAFA